ncbi:DUF1772 domain-containing protein [Prauserella oleivorans]|uniref:DUF1772 domain-containing protein n=1 Tax=Prauserella oleivorans TaxID=1478153 RepID=A0ABW5WAR9_9PSEU
MNDELILALTLLALLGSALVAGVFFAFSTFVMRALARLPAATGIAAMQSINTAVLRPSFLGVFVGTALLSAALAVLAVLRWPDSGSPWLFAGGLLYVVGSFVLTRAVHIPRNDALQRSDADSEDGAALWARYVPQWTVWNHVRTLASLAACACFAAALVTG